MLPKPIYDALRDKEKGSVENSLGIASELLDKGVAPLAEKVEQLARQQIDQLRQGVERAAESVLGDDTEALRRAKRELDDLARQLENELGAGEPKAGANAGQSASTNSSTNLLASAGAPQGANGTNAAPALGQGERPGQTAQNSANRNGEQPGGQAGQNGQQPGQQPGQPSQEGRGQSPDRKSTRLNSSHERLSRMPSSA